MVERLDNLGMRWSTADAMVAARIYSERDGQDITKIDIGHKAFFNLEAWINAVRHFPRRDPEIEKVILAALGPERGGEIVAEIVADLETAKIPGTGMFEMAPFAPGTQPAQGPSAPAPGRGEFTAESGGAGDPSADNNPSGPAARQRAEAGDPAVLSDLPDPGSASDLPDGPGGEFDLSVLSEWLDPGPDLVNPSDMPILFGPSMEPGLPDLSGLGPESDLSSLPGLGRDPEEEAEAQRGRAVLAGHGRDWRQIRKNGDCFFNAFRRTAAFTPGNPLGRPYPFLIPVYDPDNGTPGWLRRELARTLVDVHLRARLEPDNQQAQERRGILQALAAAGNAPGWAVITHWLLTGGWADASGDLVPYLAAFRFGTDIQIVFSTGDQHTIPASAGDDQMRPVVLYKRLNHWDATVSQPADPSGQPGSSASSPPNISGNPYEPHSASSSRDPWPGSGLWGAELHGDERYQPVGSAGEPPGPVHHSGLSVLGWEEPAINAPASQGDIEGLGKQLVENLDKKVLTGHELRSSCSSDNRKECLKRIAKYRPGVYVRWRPGRSDLDGKEGGDGGDRYGRWDQVPDGMLYLAIDASDEDMEILRYAQRLIAIMEKKGTITSKDVSNKVPDSSLRGDVFNLIESQFPGRYARWQERMEKRWPSRSLYGKVPAGMPSQPLGTPHPKWKRNNPSGPAARQRVEAGDPADLSDLPDPGSASHLPDGPEGEF